MRQLVEAGWRVTVLARPTSPMDDLQGLEFRLHEGDITNPTSLEGAIEPGTDAVFHVAASTNIWSRNNDQQTRINVDGTRNMIEAAAAAGVARFIHTSTFVVWGFPTGVLTENSERVEEDGWINYIRTKRLAEDMVKEAVAEGKLDAVICNPAHVLGPGDRHNWSRMIRLVHDEKLPGVPPGGGAFADVKEIAKAHITAFERGRSGENYLLGGNDELFYDVVKIAGDILGKKIPGKASPAWLLRAAGKIYVMIAAVTGKEPDVTPEGAAMITRHIHCDSTRAVEELGYGFTPVRELLEDTCRWMKDKGMLT